MTNDKVTTQVINKDENHININNKANDKLQTCLTSVDSKKQQVASED